MSATFSTMLKRLSPTDKEFLAKHASATWNEASGNAKRTADEDYRRNVASMDDLTFAREKAKLRYGLATRKLGRTAVRCGVSNKKGRNGWRPLRPFLASGEG